MSHDRCYGNTLTSADRLYLDRLWRILRVDPYDDTTVALEQRIIAATLHYVKDNLEHIRQRFDAEQR